MVLKKYLFLTMILYGGVNFGVSQTIDINVTLINLHYDTIWFGNTVGKRSLPSFHVVKSADGTFQISTSKNLTPGIYNVIFKRSVEAKYSQIPMIINGNQNAFSFTADVNNTYETIKFNNCDECNLYYEYYRSFSKMKDTLDVANDDWKLEHKEETFKRLIAEEQKLRDYQSNFVMKNKGLIVSDLISKSILKFPNFKNEEERNKFLRADFLKQYKFDDSYFKVPLGIDLLDYYCFTSGGSDSDEVQLRAENMLNTLANANDAGFRYYFNYMCNSYSKMSANDYDKVFSWIYKNYILQGKASWLTEQEMLKYKNDANNIDRLMTGQTAPDLVLDNTFANTAQKLSEIKSKYKLLIFWSPDCGHCKKELPLLKQIYNKRQDQDFTIVTICAKKSDQLPACWDYVNSSKFPESWLNLSDGQSKSRMIYLYDVGSFPRLYLLDENMKILYRKKGEASEKELNKVFSKFLNP